MKPSFLLAYIYFGTVFPRPSDGNPSSSKRSPDTCYTSLSLFGVPRPRQPFLFIWDLPLIVWLILELCHISNRIRLGIKVHAVRFLQGLGDWGLMCCDTRQLSVVGDVNSSSWPTRPSERASML